jgi:hypothetical protein
MRDGRQFRGRSGCSPNGCVTRLLIAADIQVSDSRSARETSRQSSDPRLRHPHPRSDAEPLLISVSGVATAMGQFWPRLGTVRSRRRVATRDWAG